MLTIKMVSSSCLKQIGNNWRAVRLCLCLSAIEINISKIRKFVHRLHFMGNIPKVYLL